jgi:tricarballylate dehydrogenase
MKGTLDLSRTNRFFLGGGTALLNAYHLTAASNGVAVTYDATVSDIAMTGQRCQGVVVSTGASTHLIEARAIVVAAGGFEANRQWLARYWGDAAWNFAVRGSPSNDGLVLDRLLALGARPIGDPSSFHAVAVDARAPMDDAGIVSRLDAIPSGIVVNNLGCRFSDEGEDIWPKRYATWGRLIAEQPDQVAYAILDSSMTDDFMATLYPPISAPTIAALGTNLGIDGNALAQTVGAFNASVTSASEGETGVIRRYTIDLHPPKSQFAKPIVEAPFLAYPLRPGITFTYHGVEVDDTARVLGIDGPFENLFAAGEIMAGNILTRGYLAGIGMTIGTVFGRLAGRGAASIA